MGRNNLHFLTHLRRPSIPVDGTLPLSPPAPFVFYMRLESPACPSHANVGINSHAITCISIKRIGSVDIGRTEL